MTETPDDPIPKAAPAGPKPQAPGRDDRLKAALQANLARRKGQARARAHPDTDPTDHKPEADPTWIRS